MVSFDEFGELGAVYAATDWAATPVGPPATWSTALRGMVDLLMRTRFPMSLMWGPEFVMLYNDAYVELIGDKHPRALGSAASDVFPEAWHVIGPMMHGVVSGAQGTYVVDEYVPLHRRGFLEECYFTFSFSAVRNEDGLAEGLVAIATETTPQVISRRRLWLLSRLNEALTDVAEVEVVRGLALPLLRASDRDFPTVDLEFDVLARRPVPDGTVKPVRFSLGPVGGGRFASLVVGLSPHLAPDEDYLGFLRLIASALRDALDRVRTRAVERRAAEIQRGMSEAFQRSLLPVPLADGRPEVAVRYRPAAEEAQIGGDWYDLFRLPDGSLAVVIGDVAGHDQQSAAAMAQVRNMTRGVAYTLPSSASPAAVLRGLDRAMLGTAQDVVATAVVAHVRLGRNGYGLTWSNAGHPPPVLVEPDGTPRLLDSEPDLLLGLDGGAARSSHRLDLPAGSTVVLYTDGLVERRGVPIGDGLDWIVDLLRDQQHLPVAVLSDYLLEAASVTEDDVALLVLRT